MDLPFPGALAIRIGSVDDYRQLARFHYAPTAPASYALTLALDYLPTSQRRQLIAVGVLSYPPLSCHIRRQALHLGCVPEPLRWAYLNRHLRTISRVIVHPQFRGLGLATLVVRRLLALSPTRYTEAISRLASHHPLFVRAGMPCLDSGSLGSPAYYLLDRQRVRQTLQHPSAPVLTA